MWGLDVVSEIPHAGGVRASGMSQLVARNLLPC